MKKILSIAIFLSVAVAMMAQGQGTFVVSDKKGNNNLVQGVTFQHDKKGSSWMGDGLSGSIRDLQYIARTKTELATASSEDVTKILEETSGTDGVSADAFAVTLQANPSVEEAYSADDDNLVVKLKNGGGRVIYPMYEIQPLFSDGDALNDIKQVFPRKNAKRTGSHPNGKVAVFSTLKNNAPKYSAQIKLVDYIMSMFDECGYEVEPYDCQDFTVKKYEEVIKYSNTYKAIIVMSHGALLEKPTMVNRAKGVLVTGEVCDKDDPADKCWIDDEGKYYKTVSNDLNTNSNCLVYLGACYGACWGEKIDEEPFSSRNRTAVIGWTGVNIISQAHAAMLFYRLLYFGDTVEEALSQSFLEDPNYNTPIYFSYYARSHKGLESTADVQTKYFDNLYFGLSINSDKAVKKRDLEDYCGVMGFIHGEWPDNLTRTVDIWMKSLFSDVKFKVKTVENRFPKYDDLENTYRFGLKIPFDEPVSEGIYQIEIEPYRTGKMLKPLSPFFFVYSRKFGDNCALLEIPEEDFYEPSVLGTDGQPVTEITIPAGTSRTYQLDAYPGHTFYTPCLDTLVAKVSLSGTTLTVTGVSEGSTIFGVYDRQNHQMAVVDVTVTPGGSLPSYLACPDDHHPHLIDLGLPSGTKWACCNVGASTPEGYGGYYAWGETEEKTTYHWSTYIHCDGSSSTCYDLGSDIAGTKYDVAHVQWGDSWVMPSREQLDELRNNCTYEWTMVNGVNGEKFTSKANDGSIFLPAAGIRMNDGLDYAGSGGYYWSSTQNPSRSYGAYCLNFSPSDLYPYSGGRDRSRGQSVRPVSR